MKFMTAYEPVSISLPPRLLEAARRRAEHRHLNLSRYIRQLIYKDFQSAADSRPEKLAALLHQLSDWLAAGGGNMLVEQSDSSKKPKTKRKPRGNKKPHSNNYPLFARQGDTIFWGKVPLPYAIYDEETHTVSRPKPISKIARQRIDALFKVPPKYDTPNKWS